MLGNGGLAKIERRDELVDGGLAARQLCQDCPARGIGKCGKDAVELRRGGGSHKSSIGYIATRLYEALPNVSRLSLARSDRGQKQYHRADDRPLCMGVVR